MSNDESGQDGAGADRIDVLAGKAVRRMRQGRGMSRAALGAACGVSAQQIDKYESGRNRLSLSRVHRIAQALDTDIAILLSDLSAEWREGNEPNPRTVKGAELMQIAVRLDDGPLRHLLGIAQALDR